MTAKNDAQKAGMSALLRNVLTGIGTFIVIFVIAIAGISPEQYDIHVGQPAPMNVYATKDVVDGVTTQSMRDAAAAAVEPSYKSVDKSVTANVLNDIQRAFEKLYEKIEAYRKSDPQFGKLEEFNTKTGYTFTQETYEALLTSSEAQRDAVQSDCMKAARDALNSSLPEGQESAAIVRIVRQMNDSEEYPSTFAQVGSEILKSCLKPNMLIDEEITQANREKASEEVEPVTLVKREVIVRQGEIVTEAEYQMIASLGLLADEKLDFPLYGGLAILLLILMGLTALELYLFAPEVLSDDRQLIVLCIIAVLEMALCMLVRGLNVYLMPVALGAILTAVLINSRTAIFVNTIMSFMVSLLVSSDSLFSASMFTTLLMAFSAGPVAALILEKNRLRSGTLLTGFGIGAVNAVLTFALGLVSSANLDTTITDALWAFGGGIFSAVLAIGLQTLLEWLFNLATNAKLIELSNPNQPLLRRLLLEAPGTYHHSIIVANLAEAAAAAIGANGLLARVGAYYHDVGKLKRPMYFKENQLSDNPHDRTDPRVSAAILTAHPRDGVMLAQKERLPARIIDIVRQHHGDTMAVYFYDKAVKLYGENTDPSAFRYEGPRPRSKEAAVVMLADTIEAATRTLKEPTPEKMEALIQKLIQGKLNDGQLSECALTFNDIDRISTTFCTVLTGVFHERIEYPDVEIPCRIKPAEEQTEVPETAAAAAENE